VTTSNLAIDTLVYMPHIILLFGVLADMFTYDGVWSIPSLIGIMSIGINYGFRYFWIGLNELGKTAIGAYDKGAGQGVAAVTAAVTGAPTPAAAQPPAKGGAGRRVGGRLPERVYDGCSVQGFESLASEFAPQTLVVTATVFSYYCIDLIMNRGWVSSIAAIGAFTLTYLGQIAIIQTTTNGGCEPPAGAPAVGGISQGLRALFEGVLIGGSSYGIVKTYYPTRLPTATGSPFPRKAVSDLTMGSDGKLRDTDGNAYIVLPDGTAIPDLADRASRLSMGTLLGTGVPASAGCPAGTSSAPIGCAAAASAAAPELPTVAPAAAAVL
jgi:hypothetical protein